MTGELKPKIRQKGKLKKPRADAGVPRLTQKDDHPPENFSFQLRPYHPVEGRILKAIKSDFKRLKTESIKEVLIPWLADFLGIEAEKQK